MNGRVIQGFFIGGTLRAPVAKPSIAPDRSRQAPGRPASVHAAAAVQRFGGDREGFAIDPIQLGLARGGGRALPAPVLAKMEAAFQADFSNVRIHVGPQAARIGAIAFTTGSDVYFAPGQFQPDSIKGQQLIGHELAHVIQQREGRVRAPGRGVAVVQDRALEAEADRLGMRAAAHRLPVQAKGAPGGRATHPGHPGPIQRAVAVSAPEPVGAGRFRLTARDQGRAVGSVTVDVKNRGGAFVTDLGVDQSHRDRGVGKMLLAHAARTGMRFGKTSVELAADDGGSGRLLHWYKDMGFAQTGTNQRREPTFRAGASAIAMQAKPLLGGRSHTPPPGRPGPIAVVQRSSLGFEELNAPTGYGSVSLDATINGISIGAAWSRSTTYAAGAEHAEDAVVEYVQSLYLFSQWPGAVPENADMTALKKVMQSIADNGLNIVIRNLTATPCSSARGTCDKVDHHGCTENLISLVKDYKAKITIYADHYYQPKVQGGKAASKLAVQDLQAAGITVHVANK